MKAILQSLRHCIRRWARQSKYDFGSELIYDNHLGDGVQFVLRFDKCDLEEECRTYDDLWFTMRIDENIATLWLQNFQSRFLINPSNPNSYYRIDLNNPSSLDNLENYLTWSTDILWYRKTT